MSLNISIPDTFNGPLDLLLHLIRRDEMDIYDIDMAVLVNSYLEEIRKPGVVDVDEATEFIDLASRLVEIKTRMLVPPEEQEAGEADEEEDFDPRGGLVEALLEYRRFKDAARMLGDMAEEQSRRYPRVSPRFEFAAPPDTAVASSNDLMRAFQNLLDRMLVDFSDAPDVITYTEVSISTRIQQIQDNLLAVEKTRFSRLLSDQPTRSEMVGFFVAILELVRQGRIIARQADNFSDILIERREPRPEPTALAARPLFNRRASRNFLSSTSGGRRLQAARRSVQPFPAANSIRVSGEESVKANRVPPRFPPAAPIKRKRT